MTGHVLMHLAQDTEKWQALANTTMNIWTA